MTTVCWDGRSMAADKQSTLGNTPIPVVTPKIRRMIFNGESAIAGYSGTCTYAEAVLLWIEQGCQGIKPDKEKEDDSCSLMVATRHGVTYFGDRFIGDDLGNVQWAIGSGCDYALGAMGAGASAKRAIEVATRFDIQTGMGIDVLTLRKGK